MSLDTRMRRLHSRMCLGSISCTLLLLADSTCLGGTVRTWPVPHWSIYLRRMENKCLRPQQTLCLEHRRHRCWTKLLRRLQRTALQGTTSTQLPRPSLRICLQHRMRTRSRTRRPPQTKTCLRHTESTSLRQWKQSMCPQDNFCTQWQRWPLERRNTCRLRTLCRGRPQ
jgi:hypothetical protein